MYQTPHRGAAGLLEKARAAETKAILALRRAATPLLRVSLGAVFIWFGGLKAAGVSPVTDIVTGTLPWIDPHLLMPALGAAEILLGAALITGTALRLALPVLTLHLCGTFLTFLMLPDLMVTDHNPLLLTTSGEFVMKNLVLIGAALALIDHTARTNGTTTWNATRTRDSREHRDGLDHTESGHRAQPHTLHPIP